MKRLLVVCVVLAWGIWRTSAFAQLQSPATPATFEVVSVKPSDPNASSSIFGSALSVRPQGAGGFSVSSIPLRLLIRMAYGVQDFQIVGGPSWQMSSKFDIAAKATEGTKGTELLPMMKTLLAERFRLKTHTETRELPIYALTLARSDGTLGPDLKPSSADCSNAAADAQKRAEEIAKGGSAALLSMLAKGETIPCP